MKYVLLYESADDVLSKAPGRWPAHSAHGQAFQELGSLIVHGPFGDPQAEGSMAVFTSRKAAEELAQGDPFVLNGVVRVGRSASGTRRSTKGGTRFFPVAAMRTSSATIVRRPGSQRRTHRIGPRPDRDERPVGSNFGNNPVQRLPSTPARERLPTSALISRVIDASP
jgi:uncharacterized protein YciI